MRRRYALFLLVTLSCWAADYRETTAKQSPAAPVTPPTDNFIPVVPLCPECASLADEVNALKRPYEEAAAQLSAAFRERSRLSAEMRQADEAFQEASRRGNKERAAQLSQQLTDILAQRVALEETIPPLQERSDVLGAPYFRKLRELEECHRRCAPPATGAPGAGPVAARTDPPTVASAPGAQCPQCQTLANDLQANELRFEQLHDDLARTRALRDAVGQEIDQLRAERASLVRDGASGSRELQDRVAAIDGKWREAGARWSASNNALGQLHNEQYRLIEQAVDLRRKLAACNKTCAKPTGAAAGPRPGGIGEKPAAPPSGSASSPGGCADCQPLLERIPAVRAELDALAERINTIQETQESLAIEAERAAGDPSRLNSIKSQQTQLDLQHGRAVEQEQLKSKELEGLYDQLKDCDKACPSPTEDKRVGDARGAWYSRPQVILPMAGVAAILPFLGGGDNSTSAPAPPAATPAPPVTTTPPPAPAPPVTPPVTANGDYRCIQCSIRSDPGNNNAALRVCEGLVGSFVVTEGSLTIRHPSPFIDVTGANYNPASGAFELTGRGSVAGFNNVTVRALGSVTNSTGRIVFDYTVGTAGELTGGQPITYNVTLQKQ